MTKPPFSAKATLDPVSSPRLQRLITNPKRLGAVSLWNALEPDERAAAARAYVGADAPGREQLDEILAKARNFRPATVRRWPDEKLALEMRYVSLHDPVVASRLLECHHLPGQLAMVTSFLDALGVPHNKGEVDSFDSIDAGESVVRSSTRHILQEYGQRAVVYLLTLRFLGAPAGEKGRAWLQELLEAPTGEADIETERSQADDDATPPPAEGQRREVQDDPSRQASFTTLDRLLILTAIRTAQGIEGSLSVDELDDAVDELVQLNSDRHRSFYHTGYRDVLFNRPIGEELPAQNRPRLRWYWAGAIQGWARHENWENIVSAYNVNAVVQELGDGSDSASEAAAPHVVRALRQQGHSAEIARHVRLPALLRDPRLFALLLNTATQLQREGDAAGARPILELLVKTSRTMEQNGILPNHPMFLDAQRRMAHCLRQTHDHLRARHLLEDLLVREPDPNIESMVHADIGLIEGAFNELDDIQLPHRRDELDRVLEQLESGLEYFQRSVRGGTPYSAHGHYCLGVLALGRAVADGEFEDAELHLQRTRTYFSEHGASYSRALVERANLYFGIAKAQQLLSHKLGHAAKVMVEALQAGVDFPPYLIGKTIEAFEVGDSKEDLSRFAAAILDRGEDREVDELRRSEAALENCRPLCDMLYRRGRSSQRPSRDRASDLRSALHGYMKAREYGAAVEVLDGLEELANEGFGVSEFLELLQDPDQYDPAWEVTDAAVARARCLEARQEYEAATSVLRNLVHQALSRDTEEGLQDAEGILDRVKTYTGVDPSAFSDMTDRYDAVAERLGELHLDPAESDPRPPAQVRILVVGGDGRQARVEDGIRSRLHEEHPHIAVRFKQTGWGSNWKRVFQEIEREFEGHHALVIIRFMRTHLGRRIRENWPDSRPWRSCWGGGAGAIYEAVVRAAAAVR